MQRRKSFGTRAIGIGNEITLSIYPVSFPYFPGVSRSCEMLMTRLLPWDVGGKDEKILCEDWVWSETGGGYTITTTTIVISSERKSDLSEENGKRQEHGEGQLYH